MEVITFSAPNIGLVATGVLLLIVFLVAAIVIATMQSDARAAKEAEQEHKQEMVTSLAQTAEMPTIAVGENQKVITWVKAKGRRSRYAQVEIDIKTCEIGVLQNPGNLNMRQIRQILADRAGIHHSKIQFAPTIQTAEAT